MKEWSSDNPKAALMEQKCSAIVAAARQMFLECGYSAASMDKIAARADVSVKTIYHYFENKDELFTAVMKAVCSDHGSTDGPKNFDSFAARFPWFTDTSRRGLAAAAREYLHHVLLPEKMALYRVVTSDAHRFPELGRRYHQQVMDTRTGILAVYLAHSAKENGWQLGSPQNAASLFASMLRGEIFDGVLHGVRTGDKDDIAQEARSCSNRFWKVLEGGVL